VYVADEARAALPADAFVSALGDLLSTCNSHQCSIAGGMAPDAPAGAASTAFTVACELAEEAPAE
jgi:hypothetical protein